MNTNPRRSGFHVPFANLEDMVQQAPRKIEELLDTLNGIDMRDLLYPMSSFVVDLPTRRLARMNHDGSKPEEVFEIDLESKWLQQTAAHLGGFNAGQIRDFLETGDPAWAAVANAIINQAIRHPLKDDTDPDTKRMVRLAKGKDDLGFKAVSNLSANYLRADANRMKDFIHNITRNQRVVPLTWNFSHGDMAIKLLIPDQRNVGRAGQPVDNLSFGLDFHNSMTGGAAWRVGATALRWHCFNGIMMPIASADYRRVHRGSKHTSVGELGTSMRENATVSEMLRNASRLAEQILSDDSVNQTINTMRKAQEVEFGRQLTLSMLDAAPAVKALARGLDVTQGDAEAIFAELHANPTGGLAFGSNPTVWGLSNAITATAKTAGSYDAAEDLMRLGGRIQSFDQRDLEAVLNPVFLAFDKMA